MTDDRWREVLVNARASSSVLYRLSSALRFPPSVIYRTTWVNLRKDFIHNLRCQDNFLICNRNWFAQANAVIETFDEFFHAEILIETATQEIYNIAERISRVFPGIPERRNEVGQVALV